MKFKCSFIVLLLMLFFLNSEGQRVRTSLKILNDSLYNLAQSIFKKQLKDYSKHVFIEIKDSNMPEDWYAMLRVDTSKRELIEATSYIYKGKAKYLTTYCYYNKKLISTFTTKYLIKDQESNKWSNWRKGYIYWNDTIVSSMTSDDKFYDSKREVIIAYEILRKFTFLYANKKLYFVKDSNSGYFQ